MPNTQNVTENNAAANAAAGLAEFAGLEPPAKKRNLMTGVLGIAISNARCHSHMKASLVSSEAQAELAEKRAALRAAKAAAEPGGSELVRALKAEVDAITERVVRISGDAPIAMAALADWVAKSVIRYAMSQTLVAGRKKVELSALHAGRPESLDVWPLICDLDAIKGYDPDHEADLQKARAAANRARNEARKARKAAAALAAEGAAAPPPAPAPPAEDREGPHGPTTTFYTYVGHATDAVKSEPEHGSMCVATRLREVVSDVIAQLVARLSLVAKVCVLDLLGVRTLNAAHLRALVKCIYVQKLGDEEGAQARAVLDYVAAKVAIYREHLEAEKRRKWGELGPERRAELEAAKAAAAEAKKREVAKRAKERAIEMVKKAKQLEVEAAG